MHVAVIGAGASGLVAAKSMLDEGIAVKVFEKSDQVGGIWVYREHMTDDLVHASPLYNSLTTNLPMNFMAFGDFPPPICLPSFPGHKNVLGYLQQYALHFNLNAVINFDTTVINVIRDKDVWNITTVNKLGIKKTSKFRAVVVCNGHYSTPNIPYIQGQEDFPGVIQHSCFFRREEDFQQKRVLVVGGSASAVDIASLLLNKKCKVFISIRPSKMPPKLQNAFTKTVKNKGAHLYGRLISLTKKGTAILESPAQKNERKKEIAIDYVLLATGYKYNFPFLSEPSLAVKTDGGYRVRNLYKRVFHSPTLAFIGIPNVLLPPWIVFEYQSIWVARVLSGRVKLPSQKVIQTEIHQRENALGKGGKDNLFLNTPSYCNSIAAENGRWYWLWRNYWKLFFCSKLWRILVTILISFVRRIRNSFLSKFR